MLPGDIRQHSFDFVILLSQSTSGRISSPEVELIDYTHVRIYDFEFTRLYYNDTFNCITTIKTIKTGD